ncbi:uncharacterized protein [Amphiura filiformis]|uniref:uncharacterized protein n=1 Tax=Amphiura filiformis TaxID=82378 RepID=UPI003B227057
MHDSGGAESPVKIFANIFISFVGAGVLGLPFAFKEAGILEGTIIMVFVAVVSVKAMLLLIDCKYKLEERKDVQRLFKVTSAAQHSEEKEELLTKEENGVTEREQTTHIEVKVNGQLHQEKIDIENPDREKILKEIDYGDVGYYALGQKGKTLVDASIIISQIGFCCAYLIFISNNLASVIHGSHMFHWISVMLPPLAVLCMLKHLNKLAIFSLFADFANIFAYSVVFWFDFEHIHSVRIHPKAMSLDGFPFFLGIAFYCFEGAGLILTLESSVIATKRTLFRKLFIVALSIVTTLYVAFGVCGYTSFGPHTNGIITLNLPQGIFPLLVKSCLCFSLFFTYPVMMFPVNNILERTLIPNPATQTYISRTLRSGIVLLTGVIVVAIPNFTTLMALVGATCCTLLAFILPGIFHMRIFKDTITFKMWVFDVLLILLGILATIIGTWDALKRMFPSLDSTSTLEAVTQSSVLPDAVAAVAAAATADLHTNATVL